MDRRSVLSLSAITALGLALLSDNALGQQAADVDGVKAASKAFYAALAVLDNGEAMEKVWAHTPYVTYVGPRHTSVRDAIGTKGIASGGQVSSCSEKQSGDPTKSSGRIM